MQRRVCRLVAAVALALVCSAAVGTGAFGDPVPFIATVAASPEAQTIAPGFVGMSVEYKALHEYTGRDPAAVNPVLIQLLRNLNPGQSPVIRIGGDSTDSTWWPVPRMIPPGGLTYGLTPGWLRTTHALAAALNARLILGINLAAGRPAIAAAEARAMLAGIGRQYIDAFEIGNEPDLYDVFGWYKAPDKRVFFARPRGYGLGPFIGEYRRWRAAMPPVPDAGPALAELTWMSGLGRFLDADPGVGLVTFHRYPLRGCSTPPTSPAFASIPNLLNDNASAGLAQQVAPYVLVARAHGLPFRLDELNSAACAGVFGVSDTFASALWALDTLFNLANVGVDGVNFHTLPGAGYELFSFIEAGGNRYAYVHPEYYGMMMFAQAAPPGARILPVDAPGGPVKVWATLAPSGRIHVVMINKDPTNSRSVQLTLPNAGRASLEYLWAPSLTSTGDVTIGGRTFGPETTTGSLQWLLPQQVNALFGTYSFDLPPASAVMLTQ